MELKLNAYVIDTVTRHRAKVIYLPDNGSATCMIMDYATFSSELRTAAQLEPCEPPPWETAYA